MGAFNNVKKLSDVRQQMYFIQAVNDENLFVHPKGTDPKTGDEVFHMMPGPEGAILLNRFQADYFINTTENGNALIKVKAEDVINRNPPKTIIIN
jgi:hypothetical protein